MSNDLVWKLHELCFRVKAAHALLDRSGLVDNNPDLLGVSYVLAPIAEQLEGLAEEIDANSAAK